MLLLFLACAAPDADGVDELPAAIAFVGDPAGPGPATVTASFASFDGPLGPLEATVWTPDTPPVGAVVMMPGFLATHEMYEDYADHLASYGWLVLGFTFSANGFTDPADHEADAREAMAAIDWLEAEHAPDFIVTAGHSKGGKISVLTAIRDARVDAVVAWDPVDSGGAPCSIDPEGCNNYSVAPNAFDGDTGEMAGLTVPFLLFGAPPAASNPEEHNADRFWEGAQSPAFYVHFDEGAHADWVGDTDAARITRRTEVPWLATALLGQSGTEPWLTGDVMQTDVDAGTVTVQRK